MEQTFEKRLQGTMDGVSVRAVWWCKKWREEGDLVTSGSAREALVHT